MTNKLERKSASCYLLLSQLLFFMLLYLCCTLPVSAESISDGRQCHTLPEVGLLRSAAIEVGNIAEWRQARTVVVHTPGVEVFFGLTHPSAALFERPFSLVGARREHQSFICLMADNGIKVMRLTDILLAGTVDTAGDPLPGAALDELRALAMESLRYRTKGLPKNLAASQEQYRKDVIQKLHPRELLTMILEQPVVTLASTGRQNTGLKASYSAGPLMNLYFMRDQVITTAKGLVIGHFNATQREPETKIARFAYRKIGITPVYEVTGKARLEGGDFIPAGDTALIGQGLRTNAEAIRQLLEAQAFGTKRVAVVKDSWKNQEQMHLDTYFNIIDENLAVIVADRIVQRDASGKVIKVADPAKQSLVDLYELKDSSYRKTSTNIPFQTFLERDMGMKLIPVSNADQLKYGINFLALGKKKILAIDGVSIGYKQRLAAEGVDASWMDFSNLTGGYGAAHCTTQVLRRD
ncbi:MAG: arginine deiminase family protein [Syntrophales bacterium]|nr:arginine deiminase family protein [Syntrophales bacterium]